MPPITLDEKHAHLVERVMALEIQMAQLKAMLEALDRASPAQRRK